MDTGLECSWIDRVRSHRIGGIVVFDTAAVALAALILAYPVRKVQGEPDDSLLKWFLIIFLIGMLIGVFVHWVSNTPTTLNAYLGLNEKSEVKKICLLSNQEFDL